MSCYVNYRLGTSLIGKSYCSIKVQRVGSLDKVSRTVHFGHYSL